MNEYQPNLRLDAPDAAATENQPRNQNSDCQTLRLFLMAQIKNIFAGT